MNGNLYFLLWNMLSLAFGAGGAFFVIRQSRRDVNGIGKKMNHEIARANARYLRLCLALTVICTPQQRQAIADTLRETSQEGL